MIDCNQIGKNVSDTSHIRKNIADYSHAMTALFHYIYNTLYEIKE